MYRIRAASWRVVPPALALLCALASGCDRHSRGFFAPNTPPTLTLTSGPVDTLTDSLSWIVDIAWTATDPDGRVDHFEWAVDPPTLKQATFALAETAWVSTTENHVTIRFRASHADSLGPGATASDFHVFALRAFDDRGGASALLVRAFYAYTVAPNVQIVNPVPNPLLTVQVPVPFRVSWQGDDPDGAGSRAPVAYRVRLLALEPGNLTFLLDPDSLRRIAVATGWAGWRTVGGDTTSLVLDDAMLTAGSRWLLALVAVDEAGAVTPYMNLQRNMLTFEASPLGGPRVHIYSPLIDYTSRSASLEFVSVSAVAGQELTFHWDGISGPGRRIEGTRWVLDPPDLNDETPRSDEASDWSHWSRFVSGTGTATFGPLLAGMHILWIEVRDDFGTRSLTGLRITCVDAPLDRDLLVVDDTQLESDKFAPNGCPQLYTRPWPSAAELDTFLYARGGVPWRCARNPIGANVPPGLLAGYRFDTLGTRRGLEDPAAAAPLATLARYRHVLWIVDARSAQSGSATSFSAPCALRAMSAPGRSSALAAYVQAGGQVWLAGGGGVYASLIEFKLSNGGSPNDPVFTVSDGELGPGRLMYDATHVRSALAVAVHYGPPDRSPAARGGWSAHGPSGTLAAPDYSRLPSPMRFRAADSDPMTPTRLDGQAALYYPTTATYEYVAAPNEIHEDMDAAPAGIRIESTLDTLYEATSSLFLIHSPAPVMLYYHGRDNEPFVFTGFDLWSWARPDCQGLVDFVLRDIWGLQKTPQPSALRVPVEARARPWARHVASRR